MKQFSFTKMHGLGNNYIYVNMFEEQIAEEELSRVAENVSNINTGIGSDGMILICPSEVAPVKMRMFNKDGSEGKSCGNGLRCVAKYAYEHKLVEETVFTIETLAGIVTAEVTVEGDVVTLVTIDMGAPRLTRADLPMLGKGETPFIREDFLYSNHRYIFTAVSMGNPHAVIFVDDIEEAPLTTLGPVLETHEMFPESVNVEFIEIVNNYEMNFRVWERGSGITQACGTGACAAVVATVLNGKMKRGEEITVHLAGGDLMITWAEEGSVMMKGPAEVICHGVYQYKIEE
ncbi:diaminopimelate epimerase [Bacillus sp. DX1.1]|uniref:diaminopimelate epimerase n=1 Tax=unclassified Bacillus (in: firmicutes) TaxID=185979 RepID=UPI002570408E|nr:MULTISPECIES: diaminopimelate epimerase [unclassified Bacillus (in: firmicutes)]MDM5157064.1 diaminopimelate epimerase [Bacillus sp. DX1.1]WJE81300.1 diaminopimelate epimerase [Bacillus sp. DX3.1]